MKWQYRTLLTRITADLDVILNQAGEDGWEIVAVVSKSTNLITIFFKRQKGA